MPLYEWHCAKCKKSIDVLRSFDEYENPPTADDLSSSPAAAECNHHWSRKVGGNQAVVKGPGWGYRSKGSW